jgi:tRNA(Ile)-lysidine synthase
MSTTLQDPIACAVRSSFPGGTVVAAVSGGPDSMAMFHALCRLGDVRVIAAHFDHRLRGDSHLDVEPVERVAERFGVRVVRGSGDVAAHARVSRASIEAAARELRYAFLERIAGETGADFIATAHTRSDQVETVMMRILRGADTRGLRGIHPRRGRVVRPLLSVSRADTLAYCEARAVPCIHDPSNMDRRYFRNRIRHDVLPSLRTAYPGIDAALERISAAAQQRFDEAETATIHRLGAFFHAEGRDGWTLTLDAFEGLDDDQRAHLISAALEKIGVRDVTCAHYRALTRGASVDLPALRVRREHDALVFSRRDAEALAGEWTITSRPVSGDEARRALDGTRSAHVAYVAADSPLTVRFARPGDRMRPFGMTGHKKLSDLFIDRKIPRRLRATTPVVEKDGEILWVVGVAVSESARVHPGTGHVVQLTATRTEAS